MKSTGIVRRVDDLGRVVVPKEIRRTLGVAEGDPLEIFVNGDQIILKKFSPGCVLCSSNADLVSFYPGKLVCRPCVRFANRDSSRLLETTV